AAPSDIIVEAASQDAVRDNALSILQNRKDLMIMSVGALLDESIFDIIIEGCKDFKRSIYLPSGAILGLDGIRSVKDELESITLVTTKIPRSLKGAKFFETSKLDIENIKTQTVIFECTEQDDVKIFPYNLYVAAHISFGGLV